MRHHLPRRAALAAVSLQALLLCGSAMGQTVQMFDEAPSLEQLRSIMVPESRGGPSRRIVLPHVDGVATSGSLQPAAFAVPAAAAPITSAAPVTFAAPLAPALQPMPTPAAEAEAPVPEPRQAPVAFRPAHPSAPRPHRAAPAAASSLDEPAPAEAVGFRINFAFNSDVIPPAYGVFLDRVAALMKEEAQVRIQIEGHTDATGPDAYNRDLSQRRAAAAAEYLVHQQGIEPDRLMVAGKGKSEPLLANPYDPRNRRVQFVRVD
jgi:outer membrane protein OmpA-like peptidoglycan-associated protein